MDKNTQNISVPENLKPEDISSGEELVPAEVAARKAREGKFIPDPKQETDKSVNRMAGYTVSEQGLVNNYAVTPEVYEEQKSSAQKRRDYTMLGVVVLAVGVLLIGAAITVNLLA